MDDLPESLNRLATRLEALERRVAALEHPSGATSAVPMQAPAPLPVVQPLDTRPTVHASGAFSVLGTAMLGIAGAYMLRAVAESTSLPKSGLAAIAILYAVLWLVWSSRAGAWMAGTIYACTSALILAPMLWELTLSFNVLPTQATAAVLGAFVCIASALAWRRNLTSVFWVAFVTSAVLAVALSIATHQLAPFIATLLMMALLCEYAEIRNHALGVRSLVAAAADLSIWALIFIYASSQSTRADYPRLGMLTLLAPGFALFAIYGLSAAIMAAVLKHRITVFETMQTMIAFILAATSLVYFKPSGGAFILGTLCLVLSAASYATVFAVLDRLAERRNYSVFSAWSAVLLLSGCLLCLPQFWSATLLGAAAVAATFLGVRLSRPTFQFHGLVFLLSAGALSGLINYAFLALAGTLPGMPTLSICLVSSCAILCYAAGKFSEAESWTQQLLHTVFAVVAIAAAAALLVQGLMSLAALSVQVGAHHLAFIRTFTICIAALGLAFSGAHWRRMELTRIGYATLVLVAAKLVFEDLRHGHLEFIAASIFLFAVTLIAVPRIARMGHRV
jgi:hypothetical protein